MSDEVMTEAEFVAKIDWEGGIFDALDYGLRAERCEPGELRDAWVTLEREWSKVQPAIIAVEDYIGGMS